MVTLASEVDARGDEVLAAHTELGPLPVAAALQELADMHDQVPPVALRGELLQGGEQGPGHGAAPLPGDGGVGGGGEVVGPGEMQAIVVPGAGAVLLGADLAMAPLEG